MQFIANLIDWANYTSTGKNIVTGFYFYATLCLVLTVFYFVTSSEGLATYTFALLGATIAFSLNIGDNLAKKVKMSNRARNAKGLTSLLLILLCLLPGVITSQFNGQTTAILLLGITFIISALGLPHLINLYNKDSYEAELKIHYTEELPQALADYKTLHPQLASQYDALVEDAMKADDIQFMEDVLKSIRLFVDARQKLNKITCNQT